MFSLIPAPPVLGMILFIGLVWLPSAYITERKGR